MAESNGDVRINEGERQHLNIPFESGLDFRITALSIGFYIIANTGMTYPETTQPEANPPRDIPNGTAEAKDGVVKDKAAEADQIADGRSDGWPVVLKAFVTSGAEIGLTRARRIPGDRQVTARTAPNPDHGTCCEGCSRA